MKKLTNESFKKAEESVQKNGRPLEKALLKFYFNNESSQEALDALKAFQNPD